MSEPHIDVINMKICMYVSLTQISLTPIATLYDNGFSGRVQNSHHVYLITHALDVLEIVKPDRVRVK